jgi:hypothetical protein
MAMKLSDPAPIKCAFQNYVQTISTATGNNRLQVNSSCVDMIMVLPMAYNWNTLVPITPSSALGTPAGAFGLLTSGAIYPVQPVHYQFNSNLDLTNEDTCRLQILVGSETYPKTIISHALDVFDINTNSFFHGSTSNKNMFYYGVQATAAGGVQNVIYSRALALASSCIHAQAFSLQSEGWSSSVLTGLDTASQNVDIIVQSQNFPAPSGANAGVQMLVALTTSQLVYDPQTASVSVIP